MQREERPDRLMAACHPLSRANQWHLAIVAFAFILSRAIALGAGMRYLDDETGLLVQLLDLDVLHHHLARGMLHLHGQPPVFNVLVGLSLKLAGKSFGAILLSVQLALSLAAAVAVYLALIALGVAPLFSLIVSLALVLNPAAILFEFDALYTTIVYAFNCFMALATARFVRSRSNSSLIWLMAIAVLMTLLRSSYQWLWVVALFSLLWWQLPASRRQIAWVGAIGVFLCLLWPAKNYILFKHFASSTYGPRNIGRVLRYSDLVRYHSPMLHAQEPEDFRQEQPWFRRYWLVPPTGYPELDDIAKASSGATNWNSLTILRVHDAQVQDDIYILRHDPYAYFRSVLFSARLYFEPSSQYFTLNEDSTFISRSSLQYSLVKPVDHAVRRVCCNLFGLQPQQQPATRLQRLLWRIKILCLGALALYAAFFCCVATLIFRRSLWAADSGRRAAIILLSFTTLYSFLVACMFDVGENMRYRFETQAIVFIVVAVFFQQAWERRKSRSAIAQTADD